MKDHDFQLLRKEYDQQASLLQSEFRRRFAGPDWDVFDSLELVQRGLTDLMYRDVYHVRMGYCGARLERLIAGQILRHARYDPIGILAKDMCAEMDKFQREYIEAAATEQEGRE